jgi:hypothetical protein
MVPDTAHAAFRNIVLQRSGSRRSGHATNVGQIFYGLPGVVSAVTEVPSVARVRLDGHDCLRVIPPLPLLDSPVQCTTILIGPTRRRSLSRFWRERPSGL